jgi:hypothetical protein
MAGELFFRTEDLLYQDEVLSYLVETSIDRQIIDNLKGRSPVILRGSRGVGKSFLLRVAEAELTNDFDTLKSLPVYLTFARATLIRAPSPDRFLAWMISKICNRIIRAANTAGLSFPSGSAVMAIRGGESIREPSRMEQVERVFEDSWRTDLNEPEPDIDIPGPEVLIDAAEDLCRHAGLRRITLLVDEAAHVFIPEQQRQFFTLMRDLRSPFIAVKAAAGETSREVAVVPTRGPMDQSEDSFASAPSAQIL